MFRKLVAAALLISFVAMSTSGILMFFVERPSFSLQMHPVHKGFGLLMVVAAISHLVLNRKLLLKHLQSPAAKALAMALGLVLALLTVLVVNNPVPPSLAQKMDEAAAAAEAKP